MNTLTLRFDQKRVDYIVNVLAQRPYAEVAETLQDIGRQVSHQHLAAQQPQQGPQEASGASKPNGAAHAPLNQESTQ